MSLPDFLKSYASSRDVDEDEAARRLAAVISGAIG